MGASGYWTRALQKRVARRRMIVAGGATGFGALFLAACGSGNNNAGNTPSASGGSGNSAGGSSSSGSPTAGSGSTQSSLVSKPVDTSSSATKGGVLNLQSGEPNSFDFTAGSIAPTLSGYVYSRLMKYKTFKYPEPAIATPEPDAATSWETSPDGLTYTYKLRPGMKFDPRPPTNGRALTSQDVIFSWNRFLRLSSFANALANSLDPSAPVTSVTAPDDSTVVAKLAFPFGPFNINYAYYRYGQIMPTESDGGGFNPKSDARGSGVWRLKSYTPSVSYEYERNPDWYDASNVNLDGINNVILPEYTTILAQFEAGKLGTYDMIQAQDVLPAKQAHNQLVLQAGDTFPTASPWIRMSYLPNSPFRDERVRQALSMLIDRDLYISTFGNVDKFKAQGLEVATRWNTVIPAGMDPYWLDPKDQKAFGDAAKNFQYNPAEAKKLLSAAGFTSAIQTPFTYATDVVPEKAAALQQMWEAQGDFKITANVVDFVTQFRPKYSQAADQFEGIAYSGASGYPDVDGWLTVYDLAGSPRAGDVDANGQPDAQLKQLITAQRAEPDQQKRTSILQDLQRYAGSKMYMLLDPGAATTFKLAWPWLGNFGVFRSQQDSLQPVEGWTHYWIDKSKT